MYSANSSSTYNYVASNFNITYQDGSGAAGDYVQDTVVIGGSTIASQEFGIGYKSSATEGVRGIGYPANEAVLAYTTTAYSNVPASMASQGIISSNAYSLWLDDLDASTGSILYGGVDTSKFQGTLQTLPVQASRGTFRAFFVTLTGVSMGGSTIASNTATAVLLDSGTSLTYLPNDVTNSIYSAVGAKYDSSRGIAYVSCSLANNAQTLDFTFSSPTISVSLSELVLQTSSSNGQGSSTCAFGIAPAGSSTPVLGDTFLRSAYVVYDINNNQISIAQTNFNSTTSNILEIANATSGVPSAAVVQNPVAATGAITKGIGGATVVIAAPTSTSTAGARQTHVPLGAIGLVGAGLVYAAM